METDQIERLLAHDPLVCHYTVTAKDELPEIVETYPFALVCNTHNADQPGEHWVALYVTTSIRTDNHRNTSSLRTL